MVESPSKKRKKSTALKGSYKKLKLNDEEQDASTSKVQAEPKPIPDIAEYVKITARAKRQSDCQYKSTESKKMGYVNKRRKKNSEHKNSDDGDNFILKGSAVEILKQLQKAGIWTMLKDIDAKLETQKSLSEGESNIGEEERRKLKENTNISTSSELSHETVKIPSTQLSYTNVSSPERCLQKKNKLRPVVVIEKLNQEEQKCLSSAEKDSSASSEKSGVKSRCIIKNQKEKFISSLQCPESAEKLVPEELPMTVSEYNAYASLTQMEMNRLSIPTLEQTAKKYYGSLLHNKADSFTPSQKRAKNVPSSKNSKCSKNMHGFGDKPMKENFQQDLVLPEKVEKYPPSKLNVDAELWRAKQDQLRKMVKMPVKKRDQPVKVKNVAESKTEQQLLKVNKNESVLLLKEKPQCISPKLNKNIDEAESHMKSPPTEMKAGKTCSSQSRRRLSDIASSTSIAEKEEKMRVKQRGQPREVANAPQNKTKQPLVQVNEIESALLVEGKPNCTSTPKHNRYVDEAESNFMLPPSEKKFESKTYSRASRRFSSDSSRSSNLSETSINEKEEKVPVEKRGQLKKVAKRSDKKAALQLVQVNKIESAQLVEGKPNCTSVSKYGEKDLDEAESNIILPPLEKKTCSRISRRLSSDDTSSSSSSILSETSIDEKEEKVPRKSGQPRKAAIASHKKSDLRLVQVNKIESAQLVEGKPNCISVSKYDEKDLDEAESNIILPPSEKKTCSRISLRLSNDDTSIRCSILSETSIEDMEEKMSVKKRDQLRKVANAPQNIAEQQLVHEKPSDTSVSEYEKNTNVVESNIISPPEEKVERKACVRRYQRLISDDASSRSSVMSENSINENEEVCVQTSRRKFQDKRLFSTSSSDMEHDTVSHDTFSSGSHAEEGKKIASKENTDVIICVDQQNLTHNDELSLQNISEKSLKIERKKENSSHKQNAGMHVRVNNLKRKGFKVLKRNNTKKCLRKLKPKGSLLVSKTDRATLHRKHQNETPKEVTVNIENMTLHGKAPEKVTVTDNNASSNCSSPNKVRLQSCPLAERVNLDIVRSGHSHSKENLNSGRSPSVENVRLGHFPLFETPWSGHSPSEEEVRSTYSPSVERVRTGQPISIENPRSEHSPLEKKVKSAYSSPVERVRPEQSVSNVNPRSEHSPLEEKVKSAYSSPVERVRPEQSVSNVNPRSEHSPLEKKVKSAYSSPVERVRPEQSVSNVNPRSEHSPLEKKVKSAYSSPVERVRPEQSVSNVNPRSEHSPLEKKVKSAYSSPVERVRPEQSVSNVNPRSEHSPLEKKVKSAYSSPVERVRPEQSVSNVNPRSEQSPLEKKVKSAYSSPVERVRPEQSVSVDMDQRSGCSPSVENPRYEHSPPVEYPRSGHSHLEEKVNSTYTSSVEKVRTGQSVSVENPRPWLLSPVDNLGLGNSPTFENPRSQCCSPFENGRSDCSSSSKSTRSGYSPSFENPRPWVFSPIDNVALGNSPAFENPRSVCSSFENERSDCSPSGKSTRSGYSPSVENPRWRRSVSVENTRSGCSLSVENRIRTPEAETSEKQAVNVISQFCNSIPSRGMGSSTEKTVAEVHDSTPNNVQRFKWSFSKENVLNVKSQSPDSVLGLEVSLLQKAAVESSHVLPVCPQISGDCAGSNQNSQVSIMLKNSDFDNTSESDRDSPERIVLRDNTAIQDNVKQYEAVNSPPKDAEDVSLFKKPFPLRGQLAGTTKFSTSEGKSKQKRAWLNERLTATSDEDEDESDVLSIFTESDFGDEPELRAYKTGYDEDNDDFQRCMSPLSITDFPSVKDNYLHELSILNKETNFVAPVRMPRNVRHLNRGFENEWKGAVPNTLVIEYGHNSMLPAHVIQQSMFNLFKGYCFKFLGQGCTKSICRFRHSFPNIELEWESEMVVNVLNYARQKNFGNLVNYIVTELMFKTQRENKWMTCFKFLLELQFTVEEIAEFMKVSVECCDLKSMHHLLTSCANTLNRYPLFKYIFMYFWKEFYSHLILSVRVNPMVIEILLMHCIQHDVDDFYRKCYDMLENLPPMLKNKISKQLLVDFYDKLDGELSQGNANLTLNCSSPVSNAVDGNESVSFVPGSCSELSGPSPTHDAPSIPPDNVLLNSEAAAIRKWLSANDVTSVTVSEKPEVPSVLQKLLPNPDLTSRTVDGKREVPSAQKQLHSTSRTVSDKQTGSGLLPSPDLTSRTVDGKTGVPSAQKQLHSTSRTVSDKQTGSGLLPSPDLTSRTVDGKTEVPSAQKQLHSTSRTVSDKQKVPSGSALLPSPDLTSRTVDGKPEVPSAQKQLHSTSRTVSDKQKLPSGSALLPSPDLTSRTVDGKTGVPSAQKQLHSTSRTVSDKQKVPSGSALLPSPDLTSRTVDGKREVPSAQKQLHSTSRTVSDKQKVPSGSALLPSPDLTSRTVDGKREVPSAQKQLHSTSRTVSDKQKVPSGSALLPSPDLTSRTVDGKREVPSAQKQLHSTSRTVSDKQKVPSGSALLPSPDLTSRTVDGKREVPSAQKQLHSTSRTVNDKQKVPSGSALLPSPDFTSRTVDGKTEVPSAQKQLHSTSRTVSDKQKVPSGSALLPSPDLTSRTVDGKREVPSAQKQLHSTSRTVSDKQTGSALLPSPDFTSRTVDGKPEVPSVSKRLSHNDTIPNTRKLRRTQYSKPLKQMDSSDSVVAPDFQNNCSIQLSQWQTSSANTAQKIGEFSKHPHISVQPDVKEKFLRSIQDGNYKVMFSILEEWAKKALTSSMDHNIFIDLQNIFWNISTSFFNLVNYSDFKVNPLRKKIMANFGMNRILECMEDDKWNEAFDIYRWMIQNHVRIEEAQVPDKLKTPCTNILSCAEVCIRAGKLSESIRLLKSRNLSMMDNKCWRVRGSTEDLQVLQMLWSHIFQLLVKRDLQKALDQYLEIINIQEHVDRYLIECGVAILVQMLQMRKDEMSVTLYASIEETCYNCLDHSTVRMLLVTLVNQNKERMAKTLFYRAIMIGTYPHIKTEDNTKCARVLSYMTREEMILGVKHLLDEIYTEVKNSPDLRNKYQAKIIIEEKELEIDKHMFLYLHTTTLNTLLEAKKRVLSVLESLTPSIAVVQALDDCIILDDDCIQEYLLHIRKMRPTTMPHQKQLPAAAVVK